jgi:hypothetical protein
MESRMGGISAKCKESKEKNPLELQYEPELTVVIAPEDTAKQKA